MKAFDLLQSAGFILVALAGTAVVFTRSPKRQVFMAGIFGLSQALLFYLLHSPDVALSELAVGTVGLPVLLLATLAKLERTP
jgi:energy-converting hydrogenase B subunit D